MIDTLTSIEIVQYFESREVWYAVGAFTALAFLLVFFLVAISKACITLGFVCKFFKRHIFRSIVFLSFASVISYYGMTKGTITYPRTDPETWYLMNNGSYVTNDSIHVAFTRNIFVPVTANFYIDGLSLEYTNQSDWASHSFGAYSNTFSNMIVPFDMAYQCATNYNWIAYTDWTHQPVTRTNGVAFVLWQIGLNKPSNNIAMTRTGVYTNAVRIAPNPAITNGTHSVLSVTIQEGENENE